MSEFDLNKLRENATAHLNKRAAELHAMLSEPETRRLDWVPYKFGMKAEVGRGHLEVHRASLPGFVGVRYTSSMGANSGDSYSGFLPGVTFEEALRLVYRDYQRNTSN